MLPNTDLKDIMFKTQTTDFFIACKESRIEKNTSFYGCFYLGPFDDSLSQTLANDLRRTLLSELTGLAITSIEIEGVLHKFSSLPGMKESVLDLICNLQNIVLKKTTNNNSTYSSPSGSHSVTIFKKTYIGFLNVSGPRVIFAKDLKLPAGLQCVDPNQYIATLAEDGILNIKFNINEGKNFIKQKSNNLDVNVLKKRNMLLRWSKTINQAPSGLRSPSGLVSEETKKLKKITNKTKQPNKLKSLSGNTLPEVGATSQRTLTSYEHFQSSVGTDNWRSPSGIWPSSSLARCSIGGSSGGQRIWRSKNSVGKTLTSISNPIPLDAVFMPVTKINCIIEENNLYSLGTSDVLNISNTKYSSYDSQYNNKLYFDTIYQTCFILTNKIKTKQNIKFLPFGVNIPGLTINTQKKLVGNLNKVFNNFGDDTLVNIFLKTPYNSLIPYMVVNNEQNFLSPLTNMPKGHALSSSENFPSRIKNQNNNAVQLASSKEPQQKNQSPFGPNKNFSKIKTFLGTKKASHFPSQIYLSQLVSKNGGSSPLVRLSNFASSPSGNNTFVQTCASANILKNPLDYTNVLKLKPLPKKSHLIIEIWTNGSIHPRQALYQSFTFLTNNFLKLQTVKMLGARFRSELAYTNIKYSLLKNYITNYSTNKQINQAPSAIKLFQTAKGMAAKQKSTILSEDLTKSFTETTVVENTRQRNEQMLKAPISILKISLRSYTLLKKAGIKNLNDLLGYTRKDLLNIKNFGVKSLTEIETSLSVLGLKLKN